MDLNSNRRAVDQHGEVAAQSKAVDGHTLHRLAAPKGDLRGPGGRRNLTSGTRAYLQGLAHDLSPPALSKDTRGAQTKRGEEVKGGEAAKGGGGRGIAGGTTEEGGTTVGRGGGAR